MNNSKDIFLKNLVKQYGDTIAVNGINLDIPAGSYCCLVGPSGCGKTSTLRMISGHEEITQGSISIGDKEVKNVPPAKRGTAMMFQNYALFPHLNCLDNVAFSMKMKGMTKNERYSTARKYLELVHMENYESRFPAQLSGLVRPRGSHFGSAVLGRLWRGIHHGRARGHARLGGLSEP